MVPRHGLLQSECRKNSRQQRCGFEKDPKNLVDKKSTHNAEVMSTAAVVHEVMEMIYKCHCQLEVFCHAMRNNGLQKLFNTARKIHYKEKRKTATNNEIFGQSWYMSAEKTSFCWS